jgi:hypothetical protein
MRHQARAKKPVAVVALVLTCRQYMK